MLSVTELTDAIQQLKLEGDERRKTKGYAKSFRKKAKDQINYELRKLEENRLCRVGDKKSFSFLEGLSRDAITEKLENEFYSYSVMEAFRCSLNIILDSTDDPESLRQRMHEFIGSIKRFGSESVNGYAMKASIENVNSHVKKAFDMFVLKCPRSLFKSHEMVHEVLIGLEGLNEVRKKCPNFSYVYDSFKGGAPVINKDKEVVGWSMPGAPPVSYAVYENIAKAIPINDVESGNEFLLLYMQCILALIIAEDECDFTHYDAHGENVLLKPVSMSSFYIEYPIDGAPVWLKSNGRISTFIDYGMSHIKTKDGRHIGILDTDGGFDSNGIKSDQSNVLSDAYKLVCMVMTMTKVQSVKDTCKFILGYFFGKFTITDEEMAFIINRQWPVRYHVPLELTKQWSMRDLFVYCTVMALELSPDNVMLEKPDNVLGDGYKPALKKEITSISSLQIDVPSSYNVYGSKGNPEHDSIVASLKRNPQAVADKEANELEKYFNFTYEDMYYAIPSEVSQIESNQYLLTESIIHIAQLNDTLFKISQEIEYLTYCEMICPGFFGDLITKLTAKKNQITVSLMSKKASIMAGSKILDKIVFGFVDRAATETETEIASKHPLYVLCDTYKGVSKSLDALLSRK